MRKIVILLCALCVVSCAGYPKPEKLDPLYNYHEAEKKNDYGLLIVTRENNFIGSGLNLQIYVDDKIEQIVKNGETITLEIPVGVHEIRIMDDINKVSVERKVEISIETDCIVTYRPKSTNGKFSGQLQWELRERI